MSITLINGRIDNYNIDISIVNQFCKSNGSNSIEAVLRARKAEQENHYSQVIDYFGFDRLVPFVVSISGVLGEKAKSFFQNS